LIIGAAVAAALPGPVPAARALDPSVANDSPTQVYGPSAPVPAPKIHTATNDACKSRDPREIVVCAKKRQEYRIDPSVSETRQQAESSSRSASAPLPAAQASCAGSPMGCGTGLEGLDLANVALVLGTMAVRAAKGDDWAKAFRTGGPDEYQLYKAAKKRREALEAQRAAASRKAQNASRMPNGG
jgi:hypothetical protein